ncbi:MAG: YdbL family protein, partial [Parvularculaceae bacterium]|nr:YdbL family protein [Parvularculaceae bacterium]
RHSRVEPMTHKTMKTILAAAAASLALSASALAASPAVEAAKSQCLIGEQADGYLGIVDAGGVDESLRREVKSINLQRKAAYADLAARNGVSIESAAALTAEKLLNTAPAGQCVRMPGGEWVKK